MGREGGGDTEGKEEGMISIDEVDGGALGWRGCTVVGTRGG